MPKKNYKCINKHKTVFLFKTKLPKKNFLALKKKVVKYT